MPRRTFEQHFLKEVGMTAYTFICRCRVDYACQLLAGPAKRSLTEIASLSGFSDLRRFRLVFRRLMGKTPAAYQRQNLAVA
jgi:transcriptional regulator GlxA family with amidase domain